MVLKHLLPGIKTHLEDTEAETRERRGVPLEHARCISFPSRGRCKDVYVLQAGPGLWVGRDHQEQKRLTKCTKYKLLLLLLLSCFSRVRLCATPETAAHQAPPSLGFSRQEYWSGLPLSSPNTSCTYLKELLKEPAYLHLIVSQNVV